MLIAVCQVETLSLVPQAATPIVAGKAPILVVSHVTRKIIRLISGTI